MMAVALGNVKYCVKCGHRHQSQFREVCSKCWKKEHPTKLQREAIRLWDESDIEPEFVYESRVKQMTDQEVLIHLKDLCKRFADLGDSSPPVIYHRGTPEFEELARLYA